MHRKIKNPFLLAIVASARSSVGFTSILNQFVTPTLGVAVGTSLALGGRTALTTTNQSGTGSLVLVTGATLVTPTLGVAAATTINKVTITTPATGSTLTIVDGKTLTVATR